MASAKVGSLITSCQASMGSWLVIRVDPTSYRSSTISIRSRRWLALRRSGPQSSRISSWVLVRALNRRGNRPSERALRPIGIGCKNWLFAEVTVIARLRVTDQIARSEAESAAVAAERLAARRQDTIDAIRKGGNETLLDADLRDILNARLCRNDNPDRPSRCLD
jgi:hypothetical protein